MREFRTDWTERERAKRRRAELRAFGMCINGMHGPATHGVRCARCKVVHSGSATRSQASGGNAS